MPRLYERHVKRHIIEKKKKALHSARFEPTTSQLQCMFTTIVLRPIQPILLMFALFYNPYKEGTSRDAYKQLQILDTSTNHKGIF